MRVLCSSDISSVISLPSCLIFSTRDLGRVCFSLTLSGTLLDFTLFVSCSDLPLLRPLLDCLPFSVKLWPGEASRRPLFGDGLRALSRTFKVFRPGEASRRPLLGDGLRALSCTFKVFRLGNTSRRPLLGDGLRDTSLTFNVLLLVERDLPSAVPGEDDLLWAVLLTWRESFLVARPLSFTTDGDLARFGLWFTLPAGDRVLDLDLLLSTEGERERLLVASLTCNVSLLEDLDLPRGDGERVLAGLLTWRESRRGLRERVEGDGDRVRLCVFTCSLSLLADRDLLISGDLWDELWPFDSPGTLSEALLTDAFSPLILIFDFAFSSLVLDGLILG